MMAPLCFVGVVFPLGWEFRARLNEPWLVRSFARSVILPPSPVRGFVHSFVLSCNHTFAVARPGRCASIPRSVLGWVLGTLLLCRIVCQGTHGWDALSEWLDVGWMDPYVLLSREDVQRQRRAPRRDLESLACRCAVWWDPPALGLVRPRLVWSGRPSALLVSSS
ncbi:hypothetical protein DFP72DRAFT_881891, partial [Ephemerocybe angulata]